MIGLDQLGARLAEGRREQRLSQREVARRVGVSASLISQIESGKVQPSVATLMAIVSELDLSIDQVLRVADRLRESRADAPANSSADSPTDSSAERTAHTAPPPTSAVRDEDHQPSADVRQANPRGRRAVVQHGAERALIELSSGVTWERLTTSSDADVDFILVTYPPGATSSEGDQLLTHTGTEYWYIISGVINVRLVFDEYCAGPDDSFSFRCTLPHQFRNEGDVPVCAVVTIVHGSPSGR